MRRRCRPSAARSCAPSASPRRACSIGRDTRESGPAIEQHLAAGLAAEGAHPESAGIIPTPAIAHLARQRSGARRQGLRPRRRHLRVPQPVPGQRHQGLRRGRPQVQHRARGQDGGGHRGAVRQPMREARGVEQRELARPYLAHLKRSFGGTSLKGMHLAIDCANGATSFLAPRLFEELGARVTAIHHQPDGRNINEGCGATHAGDGGPEGEGGRGRPRPGLRRRRRPLHPGRLHRTRGGRRPRALPDRAAPAEQGRAQGRGGGGHGHEQRGARDRAAARRAFPSCARPSGTATCSRRWSAGARTSEASRAAT